MVPKLLFIFSLFALSLSTKAQVPYLNKQPLSLEQTTSNRVPIQHLKVTREDLLPDNSGKGPLHIGNHKALPISSTSQGVWGYEGNLVTWMSDLRVDGAPALSFLFEELTIPVGGALFVTDTEGKVLIGPITHLNNPRGGRFSSAVVEGSHFRFEYNGPVSSQREFEMSISHAVVYFEHFVQSSNHSSASRSFGDSGGCQVNANCDEGDDWGQQKQAVVRIILTNNGKSYACTGTFVNNWQQDCRPLILTADHCMVDGDGKEPSDSDFDQWSFNVEYMSSDCDNPLQEGNLADNYTIGCDLLARSGTSGERDSDFLLLELDNPNDLAFFDVYFAGWDKRNVSSSSGVVLHHPNADIMKIATYEGPLTSTSWGGLIPGTHWETNWKSTANGRSVMEQGSSGGALFNSAGLVIGTLTGGSSSCTSGGGQGPDHTDLFGKMSQHCAHINSVRPFLDGSGSDIKYLEGISYPCVEGSVSVSEVSLTDVKVFPNPTNGEALHISSDVKLSRFELHSISGVKVRDEPFTSTCATCEIEIRALPKGAYFLTVYSDTEQSFTHKIWIQ